MRGSLVLLLALFGAASVLLAPAGAQTQVTYIYAPLSIGFGPAALTPTTQGTPVYTAGDQIWLLSDSQDSFQVSLHSPSGSTLASALVTPDGPTRLYSFSASDQAGTWALYITDVSQPATVDPIPFLLEQGDLGAAALTSYAPLPDGQLQMNFTLPTTTQYDIRECALGSAVPNAASLPIPSLLGAGSLLLQRNGTDLAISVKGQVTTPFNFWLQVDQNYSYTQGQSPEVVSREVQVAATTASPLVAGATAGDQILVGSVHMRTGRFEVRGFFDSQFGLSAEQTQVLVPQDSSGWIPLSGCSASATVTSRSFQLTYSLKSPPSNWPSAVYTMYESVGVELVSYGGIGLLPAVLTADATPWGTPLTDSLLTFKPATGVQEYASGNGSLYLVAAGYPVQVEVSASPGQTVNASIPQPFSVSHVEINSSKLTVRDFLDGSPKPGLSVSVTSGGQKVADLVAAGASSVFYLPAGDYTISLTLGNSTQTSSFVSLPGSSSLLSFYFVSQADQGMLYFLLGSATVGAAASALIWTKVYRARRHARS